MSTVREPSLSARPAYLELAAFGVNLEKGTLEAIKREGST